MKLASVITSIGIALTTIFSLLNWINSRKVNYINSINSERRSWMANIRSSFIKQLEVSYKIYLKRSNGDLSAFAIKGTEKWLTLYALQNETYLLLNPTESIVEHLIKLYDDLKSILFTAEIDEKEFINKHNEIVLTQQIILKTEWKIIKKETRKGKEISKEAKHKILLETAKDIDTRVYQELIKNQI